MKFRKLNLWTDPQNSEGLVFFAQLLEELLFDYSLDTYKPSATNSSTLCSEAIRLIKDIEDELIDKTNLDHILKELIQCLKKDEIAKSLLNLKLDSILKKFENKDTSLQENNVLLNIIKSHINIREYKTRTEELLIEAVKEPKEKDRIRALTRNYVTTLINFGYSNRFLYPTAINFFYRRKITGPEDIKDFFNIVAGIPQKYTAVFRVNAIFNEIKETCANIELVVTQKLDENLIPTDSKISFPLANNESYLVAPDIEAMDVFSARDEAESHVNKLTSLSSFFHHSVTGEWRPRALLINLDSKKLRLVSSSKNPMMMCSDSKMENAAIKLNSFIQNFSLLRDSFNRFNRAMQLHALALKSNSHENQLLNLWVALETLVPSKLGRNKAKINNIIDSILPFISIVYIETLTHELVQEFFSWNKSETSKLLDKIEGNTDREKLIKLLVLDEYEPHKTQLYNKLKSFHLLRNRADYFSKILSDPKKLHRLLESHSERVGWQIRRIYRTRNLIVHAGQTPSYIDILIKNTHDYLDIVINTVCRLASDGNKFNTLDSAFKFVEIKYSEYLNDLKESNLLITKDNIVKLVVSNPV